MTNLGTALLLRTEAFNPPSRVYERVLQRRAEAAEAARLEAKVRRFNFGAKAHPRSSDDKLKEERTPKKSIIGGEALLDAALEDDYAKEHRDYLTRRRENQVLAFAAFHRAVQLNPDHHAAFKGVAMAVPGAVHIGFRDFRASDAVPSRVEISRRFGTSRPNFEMLELGHIDVDSADFWTDRSLSSSSRSRAEALVSHRSITRTLKSG